MLVFIGLGLHGGGISLQGLQAARGADVLYAELYTSLVPELNLKELERKIGKQIHVVNRKTVEEQPDEILKAAKTSKVAFLVPGDPMVATTHVDLRLRAAKAGIETKVVHAASIASAAAGLAGLQSYKFGRTATVPFPDNPSQTPYEVLVENRGRGLHTLLLLDIRAEENRAMTANEAISIMLGLEKKLQKNVFTQDTLAVVVARAGSDDVLVKANKVGKLRKLNFRSPPHVLIMPGELHFVEAEALKVFAGAPEETEMTSESSITPEEMRAIEERAERLGVSRLLLMENAGKAVADYIARKMGAAGRKVVVVAGTGNNGGDGFVAAKYLAAYGALVKVFLVGSAGGIRTMEASLNWKIIRGINQNVELIQLFDASFMDRLTQALSEADVGVDAIFGTGIKGELRDPHASVIKAINESKVFKLAVDVPSGLDPLTGEVCGRALMADATITFHRAKKGLFVRNDLVGELVVANIGIPPEADKGESG